MSYVDGFVVAVPTENKEAYRKMAETAAVVFKECGALHVMEAWGDDVPEGKLTDFRMSVKAEENETVVFSWVVWPDKPTRDAGQKKLMEDERLKAGFESMPFDGKRMIYGGFVPIVDVTA